MYSKEVEKIINNSEAGHLFIINDFLDIASYETIKKIIQRLVNSNCLIKVIDGIYMKPKFSKIFNKNLACNIYDLAECIARKNGWDIIPTGEVAINYFKLSTQVQAKYIFSSSGPYKTYVYLGNEIVFKHIAPKKMINMSKNIQYLVQAINYLGKDNVTEDIIEKLSENLSESTIMEALQQTKIVDAWIYEVIKKIKEYKFSGRVFKTKP